MILKEATFDAFGHWSSDLCGEIRILRRGDYSTFSQSCSAKMGGKQKGKRNPNFGKHLLGETSAVISAARKGKSNANYKGGLVERVCLECGDTFKVKQHVIKDKKGKYCSPECYHKATKGKRNPSMGRNVKGANNPRWLNSISFEPYCMKCNKGYKDYIRNLFGNECFLCSKAEADNRRKLDVHHVNYNKDCGCDGAKCICVPLCIRCHRRTNGNRECWQALIMEILTPIKAWM